jgi:hypothetical protein
MSMLGTFLALLFTAVTAHADVIESGNVPMPNVEERPLPQTALGRTDRIVRFVDVVDGKKIVCFAILGGSDTSSPATVPGISCVPLGSRPE